MPRMGRNIFLRFMTALCCAQLSWGAVSASAGEVPDMKRLLFETMESLEAQTELPVTVDDGPGGGFAPSGSLPEQAGESAGQIEKEMSANGSGTDAPPLSPPESVDGDSRTDANEGGSGKGVSLTLRVPGGVGMPDVGDVNIDLGPRDGAASPLSDLPSSGSPSSGGGFRIDGGGGGGGGGGGELSIEVVGGGSGSGGYDTALSYEREGGSGGNGTPGYAQGDGPGPHDDTASPSSGDGFQIGGGGGGGNLSVEVTGGGSGSGGNDTVLPFEREGGSGGGHAQGGATTAFPYEREGGRDESETSGYAQGGGSASSSHSLDINASSPGGDGGLIVRMENGGVAGQGGAGTDSPSEITMRSSGSDEEGGASVTLSNRAAPGTESPSSTFSFDDDSTAGHDENTTRGDTANRDPFEPYDSETSRPRAGGSSPYDEWTGDRDEDSRMHDDFSTVDKPDSEDDLTNRERSEFSDSDDGGERRDVDAREADTTSARDDGTDDRRTFERDTRVLGRDENNPFIREAEGGDSRRGGVTSTFRDADGTRIFSDADNGNGDGLRVENVPGRSADPAARPLSRRDADAPALRDGRGSAESRAVRRENQPRDLSHEQSLVEQGRRLFEQGQNRSERERTASSPRTANADRPAPATPSRTPLRPRDSERSARREGDRRNATAAPQRRSPPNVQRKPAASERDAADGGADSDLWMYIVLGAALVVGAVLLYKILRDKLAKEESAKRKPHHARKHDDDAPKAVAHLRREETQSEVDRLAGEGRFAEAMHLLLMQCLSDMHERMRMPFGNSHTSREVLRRVPLDRRAHAAFADLIDRVELSHFGERLPDGAEFSACRASFDILSAALSGGGGAR